jgi:hypothetical protein
MTITVITLEIVDRDRDRKWLVMLSSLQVNPASAVELVLVCT